MKTKLTPGQFAQYEAVINEYDRYRKLSPEEKQDLIIRIATSTYIDLLCDWAFKHVFGHNEQNLMLLLNDILPEKIVHIDYDPNEIDLWKGDDKKVIMDVLCHTEDGRKIIVEMQRADKEFLKNRLLFYGASMIHSQLHSGESYGKLMPVYVICFMNFRLLHDTEKLIYRYQVREVSGDLYGDILNIFLCELPRFAGEPGKAKTPVETWFDILQNMCNFASKLASDHAGYALKQFVKKYLDEKGYTYKDYGTYTEDSCDYSDFGHALAKGIEQGREEEKIETARRFKNLGVPTETISTATGLSTEAIAAL